MSGRQADLVNEIRKGKVVNKLSNGLLNTDRAEGILGENPLTYKTGFPSIYVKLFQYLIPYQSRNETVFGIWLRGGQGATVFSHLKSRFIWHQLPLP